MINTILSRRSIRKYTDKPVSDKDVELLIKAAMAAPSAGNQQPWEFVVVKNKETLKAITEFHPYASMLLHTDTAIVICGNENREVFKGKNFWVQDCSAAAQNMLLTAHALGLGAVWLGIYPIEERVEGLKLLFNLPEGVIPMVVIPIGHPDERKDPANRFDESQIHYEKW